MKFGKLIEYSERNIFLQKSFRNEAEKLILGLFLFFKAFFEVKESCQYLRSLYFRSPRYGHTNKNKLYEILISLKKCLRLISPLQFEHDFSRMFHMLCSIN